MTQRTLWDYTQEDNDSQAAEKERERADRQETRRRTIKRLRGSGHWLTLLRVARSIPQPFTLNDISVAVWKACPEFFGMRGYPYGSAEHYPDTPEYRRYLERYNTRVVTSPVPSLERESFRLPSSVFSR